METAKPETSAEPTAETKGREATLLELDDRKIAVLVAAPGKRPSVGDHLAALQNVEDECLPVLLSDRDDALWTSIAADERPARFAHGASRLAEFRAYKKDPNRPGPLRRAVLRMARDVRLQAEMMLANREAPDLPATTYARTLVGELLATWCEIWGERFDGRLGDLKRQNELTTKTGLSSNAVVLYFDLVAAEYRFRLRGEEDLALSADERRWLSERVTSFTAELRRLCIERLSTSKELARRRQLQIAGWSFAAALVVAGAVYLYIASRPLKAVPASAVGKPGAILATYYNDTELKKLALSRYVNSIFVHAYGSPLRGVNADRFSIRYSGFLYFPTSGRTTLCVENDDGARVFLHDKKVIDDWKLHPKKQNCKRINVEKGWHPLRVEFFDQTARAWLRLTRGESKTKQQVIPAAHLCCQKK
ncbi:MAG: hypothetical protein KC609_14720 [Myxococcales bacterium]|nr:hypothetical protein [Myxococcales bacterium]